MAKAVVVETLESEREYRVEINGFILTTIGWPCRTIERARAARDVLTLTYQSDRVRIVRETRKVEVVE